MPNARASTFRRAAALATGLLLPALPARADLDLGGWTLSGTAELGARSVMGDGWGSSAEYEEYRDQRPGLFGGGSFLLEDDPQQHYLQGWLSDVGERDERYELEAGRWGRYRLGLEYAELPHVFSDKSLTYYDVRDEVLSFGQLRNDATRFRLRSGGGSLEFSPDAEEWQDWQFEADYHIQDRQGDALFSIPFGTPGGSFVNVERPVDERIHEVNLAARWGGEILSFEAGYTGSFFQNDLARLEIDNFPGAPSFEVPDGLDDGQAGVGQISLAPDNAAHTFRISTAAALALGFPARLAASFAYGERRQDQDFLCHTINPDIDPRPGLAGDHCPNVGVGDVLDLPYDGLDGEVGTFLANLVLTARPHRRLNLTARYRLYDYDNRTPEFVLPAAVENDTVEAEDPRRSVANQYRTQNASLDGSYRLVEGLTLRARYAWEQWSRSDDREVTRLDEHGARFALDYRPDPMLQLRASYEFGVRRGNGYDSFAQLDETFVAGLSVAEQNQLVFDRLRKFDQADRISDRVDLLALVAPREDLSFSLTGSYGKADYDNTDYGLSDDERYSLGGEVSFRPFPRLGLSSWYTFEVIEFEQDSRWRPVNANVLEDDPVNDWSGRSKDQINSLGFRADLALVPQRLDFGLGYQLQHANARTRASAAPGCAISTGACTTDSGAATSYPGIEDVQHALDAVFSFHAREDLTLRAGYRWEMFDLENFKIDDLGVGGGNAVYLSEEIGDYTAHIVGLGFELAF